LIGGTDTAAGASLSNARAPAAARPGGARFSLADHPEIDYRLERPQKGDRRRLLSGGLRRQPWIKEGDMPESVYKVIELVGTSTDSWEKAATAAVNRAAKTLRDLRVAELVEQDLVLENGQVKAYRAKVKVSFKYEG
jgi:flavin-binding protein dodecin